MDWLDEKAPIEWFAEFLTVVRECQNLDWLLLTKRPELWETRLNLAWDVATGPTKQWIFEWLLTNRRDGVKDPKIPQNVWFGVTVEDQKRADERIPELLSIPAKVRWLSVEPLLERIDLKQSMPCGYYCSLQSGHVDHSIKGIDWIVVGGESGPKRRDCGIEAIVNVCEQAITAGVPLFVKQDVAARPGQQGRIPDRLWTRKEFPK